MVDGAGEGRPVDVGTAVFVGASEGGVVGVSVASASGTGVNEATPIRAMNWRATKGKERSCEGGYFLSELEGRMKYIAIEEIYFTKEGCTWVAAWGVFHQQTRGH